MAQADAFAKGRLVSEIAIHRSIPGGTRTAVFTLDGGALVPVCRVDDFGAHRGRTTYGPEWVGEDDRCEAEASEGARLR